MQKYLIWQWLQLWVFLGKSLRAFHSWIVQYLTIILFKILQALSSWFLIIAKQPFSGLTIEFQADLSQNYLGHSETFTVFMLNNSSVDLALCFRLLSCVWWKADWTRFSSRILPVLSPIPFIFILKNSPVLNDYKHTWLSRQYA